MQATFLEIHHYTFEKVDNFSAFNRPRQWAWHHIETVRSVLLLVVTAVGAVVYRTIRGTWRWDAFAKSTVLSFLFATILLVKSLAYYWLPSAVFPSVLTGVGLTAWISAE